MTKLTVSFRLSVRSNKIDMKLVIMQPYFMPYIGYWQLLNAADKFIIYDDVNYIKQGWINRNRLLINKSPSFMTIPLSNASPFKKINTIEISDNNWREKMLKTIKNTYSRSEYYSEVFPIIERIILFPSNNLAVFVRNSIFEVAQLLDVKTEIINSSSVYGNEALTAQDRVLDICKKELADTYINAPGGRELYSFSDFADSKIQLNFISCKISEYKQGGGEFVPYLSIIDQFMYAGVDAVKSHLNNYSLENS